MLLGSARRRRVARISTSFGPAVVWAVSACSSAPPPAAEAPAPEPATSATEPAEATESPPAPTETSTSTEAAPSADAASSKGPPDTRTQEAIDDVVKANRQKIRDCYEEALKTPANAGAAGDLVVGFVIDPAGKVKDAEVNWSQSELHIPELDTCAVSVIRALTFPPSSKGMETKVNYPFNLNPKGPTTPPKKPEGAK